MSPVIAVGGDPRDLRAELLPAAILPLFNDGFVRTCDLYEEYVLRLVLGVLRGIGLPAAASEPASVAELIRRLDLDPAVAPAPLDWLLRAAARRGVVEALAGDPPKYRAAGPLPELPADEVLEQQRLHAPSALPSYRIAAVAAEHYPAFLRGQVRGDQVLFAPDRTELWAEYFSNHNDIYAVSNRIGALAVDAWVADGPLEVLELGGGLASAALALVEQLQRSRGADAITRYAFTDVALPFLRRGQRTLAAAHPTASFLGYRRLDMNAPFGAQGIAEESCDLVFAVNTLHVAADLPATLGEIRRCLRPGGQLVISECLRPYPRSPVYVELVFNLLEQFRSPRLDPLLRPDWGFLTPEHWQASFRAAGLGDVRFLPDVRRIRDHYPGFVVGAVGARREVD